MKTKKYIGTRRSKLVIISEPYKVRGKRRVKVKCDCGVKTTKNLENVLYGDTTSCGCIRFTAGKESKKNPLYNVYKGIINRCRYINCKDYHRYGGRGVKMEWNNFVEFKRDMGKSYLAHIKKYGKQNTSIDRIDTNKNYCKENCRWATTKQQSLNRRTSKFLTINGVTKNYCEWADQIGCSRQALRYRVINGLRPELILTLPFKHSNKYAKTV